MSVKFQVFRQDAWFSLIQRRYSVSFITISIHYVFSWFRPTVGPVQCISFWQIATSVFTSVSTCVSYMYRPRPSEI